MYQNRMSNVSDLSGPKNAGYKVMSMAPLDLN